MSHIRPEVIFAAVTSIIFLASPAAVAGAGVENDERWPSRTINYAICDCASNFPNPLCTKPQCVDGAMIKRAVDSWNAAAQNAIKLVPKDATNNKTPYILYVSQQAKTTKKPDEWCYTGVGHLGSNDAHLVVIGDDCVAVKKNKIVYSVVHETGHAVGLQHEQQRTDRDDYVIVRFPGSTANYAISNNGRMCASKEQWKCEFQSIGFSWPFRVYTYGQDLAEYDFASVMHYPFRGIVAACEPEQNPNDEKEDPEEAIYSKHGVMCMDVNREKEGAARLSEQNIKNPKTVGNRETGLSTTDVKALDLLYQGKAF